VARRRFTRDERAALTVGARVEWRNGRHWHPATVVEAPDTDTLGCQRVALTVHAKTRTVSKGERLYGYPGSVRVPD
jgi:hypothetical protein